MIHIIFRWSQFRKSGITSIPISPIEIIPANGCVYANGISLPSLYRPVSYVPAWSEITSNPFSFTSPVNNQLIKYNSSIFQMGELDSKLYIILYRN